MRAPSFLVSAKSSWSLAMASALLHFWTTSSSSRHSELVEPWGKRRGSWRLPFLYEAQRRSVYGEGMLVGIARQFEIGVRQAEKYALVWRTFFECGETAEHSEGATNGV